MAYTNKNYRNPYNQTSKTYTISFYDHKIETFVTKNPDHVSSWISQTEQIYHRHLHRLIVGLDTEWRPCFKRNTENSVAILQICVGSRCLIFQILHSTSIPTSLGKFLNNPNYTFTGVGISGDFEKLISQYGLGSNAKVKELQNLAAKVYGDKDLKRLGLKSLTREVLNKTVEKPKHITLSLWDRDRLSYDQVEYACLDAFVSFELGRVLITKQQKDNSNKIEDVCPFQYYPFVYQANVKNTNM